MLTEHIEYLLESSFNLVEVMKERGNEATRMLAEC
jgi:hypothetical protein